MIITGFKFAFEFGAFFNLSIRGRYRVSVSLLDGNQEETVWHGDVKNKINLAYCCRMKYGMETSRIKLT
jgi:hypothetical protein